MTAQTSQLLMDLKCKNPECENETAALFTSYSYHRSEWKKCEACGTKMKMPIPTMAISGKKPWRPRSCLNPKCSNDSPSRFRYLSHCIYECQDCNVRIQSSVS